jgi:LysM repeat protein
VSEGSGSHRRNKKIRRTGRHASPSQIEKVAQQAGKAAPAVVVAGALAAGPQVYDVSAAGPAAATHMIQAHLDAAELPAHAAAPVHAAATAHAAFRSYTVRPGDTLAAIADRFYGNPEDWRWLYHVNRAQIHDPNLIYVGQVLRIPHDPPAGSPHPHGKHHRHGGGDPSPKGKHHRHEGGGEHHGKHHRHGRHHHHGGLHGTLGCHGLEELWESVGGAHRAARTAAAIAMAESGGNQFATGPFGERGYWQINPVNGSLSTYNARGNARAAVIMSHNGTNWSPWTTYVDGAYRGRC